jgi:hypothetical protein
MIFMLLLLILASCAIFQSDYFNNNYEYMDKNGQFSLNKEGGIKDREFVLKTRLSDQNQDYEKVLLITNLNFRPRLGEYIVYLDGRKEFTKMNVSKNKLRLVSSSGEDREIDLPENTYFYSSIPVAFGPFMAKSIRKRKGETSFKMIWEGYPFYQEIYLGIEDEVIVDANLLFSGKVDELYRFTLETPSQTIFYLVDSSGDLVKQLWVAQGLAVERK